jgi:hypothetical protein
VDRGFGDHPELEEVPEVGLAGHLRLTRGLKAQIDSACIRFFKSREMPYGKAAYQAGVSSDTPKPKRLRRNKKERC